MFGTVDTDKGWNSQVCPRAIGGITTGHKMRHSLSLPTVGLYIYGRDSLYIWGVYIIYIYIYIYIYIGPTGMIGLHTSIVYLMYLYVYDTVMFGDITARVCTFYKPLVIDSTRIIVVKMGKKSFRRIKIDCYPYLEQL